KPSLQLRLSQQLTMTPQLQQAIRLLQLPVMELQAQIQEALDQNVMLEIDEAATAEAEAATPLDGETIDVSELDSGADAADDYAEATVSESEWEDVQRTGPSEAPRSNEPRQTFEYADRSNETLGDHLLWQLELERLDDRSRAIGEAIIDAINDDGYLMDDLETIRETLAPDVIATVDEIEAVLAHIQRLDPVGCGARSVSECVLLQLEQLAPDTPGLELARAITAEHLELVAEHQYGALKRLLKASDGELEAALMLERSCHPRPRASVHAPAAEYVVPDVFVRRSDWHWVVELNGSLAPQLRVNKVYASSLGRGDEYDVLRT